MSRRKPVIDPAAVVRYDALIFRELCAAVPGGVADEIDQRDAAFVAVLLRKAKFDVNMRAKIAAWLFGDGYPLSNYDRRRGLRPLAPSNDMLGRIRVIMDRDEADEGKGR